MRYMVFTYSLPKKTGKQLNYLTAARQRRRKKTTLSFALTSRLWHVTSY